MEISLCFRANDHRTRPNRMMEKDCPAATPPLKRSLTTTMCLPESGSAPPNLELKTDLD